MNDKVNKAIVEVLPVSPFVMNCIVLGCRASGKAAVIDPGDESQRIVRAVELAGLEVTHILLTHAHIDHVGSAGEVKEATGAPVYLHREDLPLYGHVAQQARAFGMNADMTMPDIDVFVNDGDSVQVGELHLRVLHAPGHSPGSICFYLKGEQGSPGMVFSGDVLFAGSIGRTDLWGGSYETLMRSIGEKLMTLPDDTVVYSGHGPSTTVGKERANNPFSRDFVQTTL